MLPDIGLKMIGANPSLPERINEGIRNMQNNDVVLMQFIGIHDKNGKDIYEGGVVRAHLSELDDTRYGPVEFQTTFVRFGYRSGRLGFGFDPDDWEYEVIGNIYENPELISPAGDAEHRSGGADE